MIRRCAVHQALCGPSIDPVLVKMNEAVLALKKQGVEVTRFNLAQQPKEFMANKTVAESAS